MVIVGTVLTKEDVVLDPRYSQLKPDQVTTKLLSEFTQEQQAKFDFEATQKINAIKKEYGDGVSTLLRIYNASGRTLRFQKQGPNWSGHMGKYPVDETIGNGQWSVVLHVKTGGAARGSVSSVVYRVEDEGDDIFMGWSSPFDRNLYDNQVYVEVRNDNHWPDVGSWDLMYDLLSKGIQTSDSTWPGKTANIKITAHIGDNYSAQCNCIVTAE